MPKGPTMWETYGGEVSHLGSGGSAPTDDKRSGDSRKDGKR